MNKHRIIALTVFITLTVLNSAQISAMVSKVQNAIDSEQYTKSFADLATAPDDKVRQALITKRGLPFTLADYKVWQAEQGGAPAMAPAAVVAPVAVVAPAPAPQTPRKFARFGKRCPTGKRWHRVDAKEKATRIVRRAALTKPTAAQADAFLVAMQQAVGELKNDQDIQTLAPVLPAAVQAMRTAPQYQKSQYQKYRGAGKPYGGKQGKRQMKVRTQEEIVEIIRCLALGKMNKADAQAFLDEVQQAIGNLQNDQEIKKLP